LERNENSININSKESNNDVLNTFDIIQDSFQEGKKETYEIVQSISPVENKVTIINNYSTVNGRLFNNDYEFLSENNELDIGMDNTEKSMIMEMDDKGNNDSHYDDIRDKILNLNSVDSNTEIYQNNSPSVRIIFYSTPDTKNITYGVININNKSTNGNNNINNTKVNPNDSVVIEGNQYSNENMKPVIQPIENHRKINHKARELYKYSWLPNYLKDDDFDDLDSLYI